MTAPTSQAAEAAWMYPVSPHLSILSSHTIVWFSNTAQTERKLLQWILKIEEFTGCDSALWTLDVVSARGGEHGGSSEAASVPVTLGQMAELGAFTYDATRHRALTP